MRRQTAPSTTIMTGHDSAIDASMTVRYRRYKVHPGIIPAPTIRKCPSSPAVGRSRSGLAIAVGDGFPGPPSRPWWASGEQRHSRQPVRRGCGNGEGDVVAEPRTRAADDPVGSHDMYADDAVLEFPQSGGRLRSLNIAVAQPLSGIGRPMTSNGSGADDLWVAEMTVSYDGGEPRYGSMSSRSGTQDRARRSTSANRSTRPVACLVEVAP